MERVRNKAVEVRAEGKGIEFEAELSGFEPSTSDENNEEDIIKELNTERIVKWERFLPERCFGVLLVEADDCTRQVVSALLRNCGYQVTAVGDGLQAWELLEDPSNHFELVLTEVVMPSLSGIGLLCKITSHENLKSIPVIMMSSLDSISIVFKCLSKGAVDFLVKPVRKNELRNLWQHVWRRCYNSSGTGSGSQNQNAVDTKSEAGSDNNTGSVGGSENVSSGLNIREESDNGSGTQGSWTNRAVVVESPQQRVKWEPHCSYGKTFTQVTVPNKEMIQNEQVQVAETYGRQDEKTCDNAMDQDLEIAIPRPAYIECLPKHSTLHEQACEKKKADHSVSWREGEQRGAESVNTGGEPSTKAVDLIGNITSKHQHIHMDEEDDESRKVTLDREVNCSHVKDTPLYNYNSMPQLELTLNWPQANWNENSKREGKCTLRQSDASAFSRYNMSGTHFSFPRDSSFPVNAYPLPKEHGDQACMSSQNTGTLRCTVPFEKVGSSKGSGGGVPDQCQLSQSPNNQDSWSSVIGPSGQDTRPTPVLMRDETGSASHVALPMGVPTPIPPGIVSFDGVPPAYGAALHPMFYSYPGVPVWASALPPKAEREGAPDNSAHHEPHIVAPKALQHSHHYNHLYHHHIQYHHHHHHHHHHHDEAHQHKQHTKQDELTIDNTVTTAPRGSSSNMPGNTLDGNFGECASSNGHENNGNGNGSASGSNNNGSNMRNGQNVTSGVEQNRFARREAAVTKFRQKRKQRCFEKKVRYQSRKMLAEQRPRVRGQFVRHQSMNKSESWRSKMNDP